MDDGLFLRHAGGLPVGFDLGDFSPALDGAAYVYVFGGRIKGDGRQGFATYGCARVFVGDNQFFGWRAWLLRPGVREAGEQGERLAFVGSPLHGLCEAEVAPWMALVRVIVALDEDLKRRLSAQQKAALLSNAR